MIQQTEATIETWTAASELDISEADSRLVLRHGSLADDDDLGVRIKTTSWVVGLLKFLDISRSRAEVAERFRSPSLGTVLMQLHRNGVIFHSEQDEQAFLVRRAATVTARRAMRIASAVSVLGVDLSARMTHEQGKGLARRTRSLCDQVGELATELDTIVSAFTAEQVANLEIARADLKLHLGCGGSLLDSWVNIDISDGDLRTDLRSGLPLPDGCAQYVYTCHMLEHLAYPDEVLLLLREVRRVLRPDGVVRIVVPNVEPCLRAYIEDDREFFAERARYWPWVDASSTKLTQFLAYFGANPDAFDPVGHRYGYDFDTLADMLIRAGFGLVNRSGYQTSKHSALRVDDWSKSSSFHVRGEHLSLFVEAERTGSSLSASASRSPDPGSS
jgi:SAM-dependent methyltransferase